MTAEPYDDKPSLTILLELAVPITEHTLSFDSIDDINCATKQKLLLMSLSRMILNCR